MTRIALLIAAAFTAGCSGATATEVHPVHGQVFFDGKPAAGAMVRFHPAGDPNGRVYQGEVGPDGRFELTSTTKGDGVPAGPYAVCLIWSDVVNVNDAEQRTPDKFGRRYATPANPYTTFDVKPGTNEVPRIDTK